MDFDVEKAASEVLQAIPGYLPRENVGIIYFSSDETLPAREQFFGLTDGVENRQATFGGVIEGGCRLATPDGRHFFAAIYRGDLSGWRSDIVEGCRLQGRSFGEIAGDTMFLSDGSRFPLSECRLAFQVKRGFKGHQGSR